MLITASEYAEAHGVSKSWVSTLCKMGRLAAKQPAGYRGEWMIEHTEPMPETEFAKRRRLRAERLQQVGEYLEKNPGRRERGVRNDKTLDDYMDGGYHVRMEDGAVFSPGGERVDTIFPWGAEQKAVLASR